MINRALNSKHLALICMITLSIAYASQADDSGMIPQLTPEIDPVVTKSGSDAFARENADLCHHLRREMDSLKGRPLRRNAVARRYDLECRQRRP